MKRAVGTAAASLGSTAIVGLMVLGAGCGSTPSQGGEGQACYPNKTCNTGLSCFSNLCVNAGAGGSGGAAGATGAAGTRSTGGVAGATATTSTGGAAGTHATGGATGGAGGLAGTGTGGATGGAGGAAGAGPFFCNSTMLGIADFDGDGVPDCVVTTPIASEENEYNPVFLKGLGYGAYTRTGLVSPIVLFYQPAALSTADLSGDGIPDLAVVSEYAQIAAGNSLELTYLKAVGDGTFTTGGHLSGPVQWALAGTGDFNGDQKPDVLVAAWDYGDTRDADWLLLSDKGSTTLDAGFSVGYQGTLSMGNVPGDFNGDHHLDVAAVVHVIAYGGTTTSQDVVIVYGAGDGTFAAPVHVPGTTGATSVSVGDLNGDGKLDLDISYSTGTDALVPLYGDEAGNFSTTPP